MHSRGGKTFCGNTIDPKETVSIFEKTKRSASLHPSLSRQEDGEGRKEELREDKGKYFNVYTDPRARRIDFGVAWWHSNLRVIKTYTKI